MEDLEKDGKRKITEEKLFLGFTEPLFISQKLTSKETKYILLERTPTDFLSMCISHENYKTFHLSRVFEAVSEIMRATYYLLEYPTRLPFGLQTQGKLFKIKFND
jgi:hypothetical protein